MSDPLLFWKIFGAVMLANVMTAALIWSFVTYSRFEKDGTAGKPGTNAPVIYIVLILAFMTGAMYVAFKG